MRWARTGLEKCRVHRAIARRVVGALWEGEVVGAASVVEGLGGVGGGMETMWAEPEAVRWVKRVVSLVLELKDWDDALSFVLELESR